MSRIAVLFFSLACCVLMPTGRVQAEQRVALVIGNDVYDKLGPRAQLKKARQDAMAVGSTLRSLGFTVIEGRDVTRSQFNELWQEFLGRLSTGDTAVFYFAGHGIELGGQNFLVPRDVPGIRPGQEERLRRESLLLQEFLWDLRERKTRVNLVILDACRENPFEEVAGRSIGGKQGLVMREPPEGTFIMFSAGSGETALDRLGDDDQDANSVYTRHLLPLMTTSGLALEEIAKRVRLKVRESAATVSHRQTPAYYNQVLGTFCLAGADCGASAAATAGTSQPVAAPPSPAAAVTGPAQSAAVAPVPSPPPATAVAECDRLAADEVDPERVAPGVKKPSQPAIEACRRAVEIEPGNRRLAFQLGRALDVNSQAPEAFVWLRKAAEAGHAEAMHRFGHLLEHNHAGVSADPRQAAEWFRKSAERGQAAPARDYATRLEEGRGIAKNLKEAARWYRRSAEAGDADAMGRYATMLEEGKGGRKDEVEAIAWYRKSAEAKDAVSMYRLAAMLDEGRGERADHREAAQWILRALQAGEESILDIMTNHSNTWHETFRRELQELLRQEGAYDGPIDGNFGLGTQAALKRVFRPAN
jgi:TPR repeat protein